MPKVEKSHASYISRRKQPIPDRQIPSFVEGIINSLEMSLHTSRPLEGMFLGTIQQAKRLPLFTLPEPLRGQLIRALIAAKEKAEQLPELSDSKEMDQAMKFLADVEQKAAAV